MKKFLQSLLEIVILTFMVEAIYCLIPVHYLDKDLKPYYDEYMMFVKSSCRDDQYFYPNKTIIRLVDLPQGKDPNIHLEGQCGTVYPYRFEISIDKTFFKNAKSNERLEVVSHELRHCLFQVGHSDDPKNYMYSEIERYLTREQLYEQILVDLKQSCKN